MEHLRIRGQDTASLVTHHTKLGFKINQKESCLVPTQRIEYLGVKLDPLCYRTTLLDDHITLFQQCPFLFHRGCSVTLRKFFRVLGLMAAPPDRTVKTPA